MEAFEALNRSLVPKNIALLVLHATRILGQAYLRQNQGGNFRHRTSQI